MTRSRSEKRSSQSRVHHPLAGRSTTPFEATFTGKCRGCNQLYGPGHLIVSLGRGFGAFHEPCWERHRVLPDGQRPKVAKRKVPDPRFQSPKNDTPAKQARREATRAQIADWGRSRTG